MGRGRPSDPVLTAAEVATVLTLAMLGFGVAVAGAYCGLRWAEALGILWASLVTFGFAIHRQSKAELTKTGCSTARYVAKPSDTK